MMNLTSITSPNQTNHSEYLETLRAEARAEHALHTTRAQHLRALRDATQTIVGIARTWVIGQPEIHRAAR